MNKVSIIIANYNYGDMVVDAIKSALNQTYRCHVGIINDGSTDNSHNEIVSYIYSLSQATSIKPNIISNANFTYINTENQGASAARNTLIKRLWSSSDFFAILDADDIYYPNKVEKLLAQMSDPNVGVVYGDYDIFQDGYIKREYKEPYSPSVLMQRCIVHSGALIRKSYLEKVLLENGDAYDVRLHGPLSKGFIGCTEDYDLWLRLSKVCIMKHVPESLSLVRMTGKNQSLKMTTEIFNENAKILQQRI
jgi:glycosyltransferase involved in cell wall biosynthesis